MGIAWPPPILDHQVFLSAIKLKENSGEIQRDSLTQTWTRVLRVQLDSCEKWVHSEELAAFQSHERVQQRREHGQ